MTSTDHPLRALKRELLVHQLCHEVDLGPLAKPEVAEYLAAQSAAASPPEALAELVHRHTEGNPLFMRAVLDHLTQRGQLSRVHGGWQLVVSLEEINLGVPENLRQMIEVQIERLSVEEQRALEAASVAGAVFSARIVAAAVDSDAESLEDLYEGLARRNRIVRTAGAKQLPGESISQRYEFVHALYREVLYRRQAPRRRAKLHQRIGERLEALHSPRLSDAGAELAGHFEESGDWPRAVKYLRLAAELAAQRFAQVQASALLEHALELVGKLPEVNRAEAEIGILNKLAKIYMLSLDVRTLDNYEELEARAAQLAARAEQLAARAGHGGLIDVQVRALIGMANFLSSVDSRRALAILDRAQKLIPGQTDPLAQARSRMQCSYGRIWAGGWNNEDAAACREAMLKIREGSNRLALARHQIDYGYILYMSSRYRESLHNALEGLAVLTSGSNENPCATVPQIHGAFLVHCNLASLGEWGQALREIEATISALTRNASARNTQQALHFWPALLHVHAGDWAGALAICESAASSLEGALGTTAQRMYLVMAGMADAGLGNHERALERLLEARRVMERQPVVNDWVRRLLIEWALTELWLAKGDLTQARAQGERFLEVTLATAERTYQALACETNARVAMCERDRERSQDCIAKALSTMEGFEVPLAAWRVHATATELYGQMEDGVTATRHRESSRATILRLADSLPTEHPLRRSFLSAPLVTKVLATA